MFCGKNILGREKSRRQSLDVGQALPEALRVSGVSTAAGNPTLSFPLGQAHAQHSASLSRSPHLPQSGQSSPLATRARRSR